MVFWKRLFSRKSKKQRTDPDESRFQAVRISPEPPRFVEVPPEPPQAKNAPQEHPSIVGKPPEPPQAGDGPPEPPPPEVDLAALGISISVTVSGSSEPRPRFRVHRYERTSVDLDRFLKNPLPHATIELNDDVAEALYACGPPLPLSLRIANNPTRTILVEGIVNGETILVGSLGAETATVLFEKGACEACPGAVQADFLQIDPEDRPPLLFVQLFAPRKSHLSALGQQPPPAKRPHQKPPQLPESAPAAPVNLDRFVAIDVETANADHTSICQIGWVVVSQGRIKDQGSRLINPESEFAVMNTRVHGIQAKHVETAPLFAEVWPMILREIGDSPIVSHSLFDRGAIGQKLAQLGLPRLNNPWIDSIDVMRAEWPEMFAAGSCKLSDACAALNIPLDGHHHAEADAVAAARIVLKAEGIDVPSSVHAIDDRSGPDTGPWVDEIVVFTGTLSIPRSDAQMAVKRLGGTVAKNVTKKTTLLIVGEYEDIGFQPDHISTKHRRALELAANGSPIRILEDAEFLEIIAGATKAKCSAGRHTSPPSSSSHEA